ncbi:MAG: glycoside hydrolase family 76 protein [Bacteroidota bacterium]
MGKQIVLLILLSFAVRNGKAQSIEYSYRINTLHAVINSKFKDNQTGLYYETNEGDKKHSYLWPLCALIQATNEMEALTPKARYMLPVENAINQYLNNAPPVPGYQATVTRERADARFFDDNQWIAIAYLDAYNRTHEKKYLDKSEMICRFMLTGLDTVAGGGFYWKEGDRQTKNTCSNGPGVLVLLQLYKITHKAEYLRTALSVYQWTNARLQALDGVYYDNIKLPSLKVGKAAYTYNTGTMLQANVLLYDITKDKKYLSEAQRVAKAGFEHFFKNGRLPNGNYWFNAVMLRGYVALYKVDKDEQWIDFFRKDADAVWDNERDTDNMLGPKPAKKLLDQAAMLEIYATLQKFKN